MRLHPQLRPLWLLPIVMVGCSSTVGSRFGGTPQSKSIAVVGERPLPATTGEPGAKVAADDEGPEPRRNPKTRISGRVIDEAGDPVAGATVRLADGGSKGGKEIRGTTDRSGAFTLNGLRAGSSYVLIAESEDDHGPIVGRVDAKTAETGVEIALVSEEKKTSTRRSARPSQARSISNREETDGGSDGEESPRINREDVSPPAEEAGAIDPGPRPTRSTRPQLAPPVSGVGWKTSTNETASRPQDKDVEDESTTPQVPSRRTRAAKPQVPADPDDEETNPLPPALDKNGATNPGDPNSNPPASASRKVSTKLPMKPRELGEIAMAPEASLDEKADPAKAPAKEVATSEANDGFRTLTTLLPDPKPASSIVAPSPEIASTPPSSKPEANGLPTIPPIGAESLAVAASEPPSPTISPPGLTPANQDVDSSNPAPQPVFASNPPTSKPVDKSGPEADFNPFANLPAPIPTPATDQVVANSPVDRPSAIEDQPTPSPELVRKKWGELATNDRPAVVVQPTKATVAGSFLRRMRPAVETKDASVALCVYDTKLLKIKDLRLPDLEGKSVRFQDLDADFILLDFWGTWCAPCLDAIPHLVALQKKYGPDKLKVVGIACEEVPPEQRKAKVDEVSRKFGINYPVLLSTMDGKPCPVQQALQIQAMPTMILVDRRGQVLWRNAGSTPASENRLDRILALSMSRGDGTARR